MKFSRKIFVRICLLSIFVSSIVIQQVPSFASNGVKEPNDELASSGRVLLVSIPRLTWKSLEKINTPNIDVLAEQGSIANLSIRVPSGGQNLAKRYATISAGHRASAVTSNSSTFFAPGEKLNGVTAREIYVQEQGNLPSNVAALSLGFELSRDKSNEELSPATIGSFASAIQGAGKSIAVFGNADLCGDESPSCHDRSVGYIGSNVDGILEKGNVSRDLLNEKNTLNMKKLEEQTLNSLEENEITTVECSDVERAERTARESSKQIAHQRFEKAVKDCDKMIGSFTSNLNLENDLIFIFSPMSSTSSEELTVFIAAGNGVKSGYAVSGITRRSGIVALADIAPTILEFQNIEPPTDMVDTLIDYKASSSPYDSRKASLMETNDRALLRDRSFDLVAGLFIVIVFFGVVLSVIAHKRVNKLLPLAKAFSLISIMMPTATFLLLPFLLWLQTPVAIAVAFITMSSMFAIFAWWFARKFGYVAIVLFVSGASLAIQLLDILFGGNLQLNSLFGYSAIVAGRFAGFGNLTFSIVSISTVLVVAMVKQLSITHENWNQRFVNFGLIGLLVFVLIVVGAPYFGSDVGGVLALTPTVFITSLMLFGKKISAKSFLFAGVITGVAISVFSVFDLTRPASERTHLGRFVEVLVNGDAGIVIEAKIVSNLRILTNSIVASVVIILTLFLMYLFLHPEQFIRERSDTYPVFKYIAFPGLVVATLGMFLNDSGVAIPGMMIAIAFPSTMLLITELTTKNQSDTTSDQ